jgi:hypothetical protein
MPVPAGRPWARGEVAISDPDQDGFWADLLPDIAADRTRLQEAMNALPPVFTHGDSHTGNVVHSDGVLTLCDWQGAGIGRPASDLAFLSVRATPSGTVVPPALLEAYLAGRDCDRRVLERALLAEELFVFVFHWPPYARFNRPLEIARVIRRTRDLASRWPTWPTGAPWSTGAP